MRPLVIVGLVLMTAGLFVGLRGGVVRSTNRSVLRLGEFEARVEEQHRVPAWYGWTGAALGLGLVIGGFRRKRA